MYAAVTGISIAILFPAIIGAISSLFAAWLMARVALRAQSAEKQLDEIRKVVETELHEQLDPHIRGLIIGEIVKRCVHEVMREEFGGMSGGRRNYDPKG